MTKYETLATLIACIAAFISLWVWRGQRKLQQEANDLQRATAKLAEKQLEILLREEKGRNKARVSLQLRQHDRHSYRFHLTNVSNVDARDVSFTLLLDSRQSPLIESEYKEVIPLERLTPGSSVSLIAALTIHMPRAFGAVVNWTNPDGSKEQEETYLALP